MNSLKTSPTQAIHDLFSTYCKALNSSDLDLAMSLYWPKDHDEGDDDAEDNRAVFIAPHSPPSVGLDAIRNAYESLFSKVDHMVIIKVERLMMTSGSREAIVRTRSTGKCRVRDTGAEVEDDVQGSWVLKWLPGVIEGEDLTSGRWKVLSYHFSSSLPPR